MNAERLHTVVRALAHDLGETQAPALVGELVAQLNAQVSNPSDAAPQQQVSTIRTRLAEALTDSATNDFPPSWVEMLDEMGIRNLFGNELRARIEEIFARNEITPSAAGQELDALAKELAELQTALTNVDAGLAHLNVGTEDLDPGEFEVSVDIPRDEVDDALRPLGKEFVALNGVFSPFVELTSGSRPELTVRGISSSAFQIFLHSTPAAAACIAMAVERVVNLYKTLLEIRLARQQLADSGIAPEGLASVDAHANRHMEEGIEALGDELVDEYAVPALDEGRRNELRTEVKLSLNAIANRIDRRYHIDVRVGLPPEVEDDEDEGDGDGGPPEDPETGAAREAVLARKDGLRYLNLSGSPILELPEGSPEEEPQAEA